MNHHKHAYQSSKVRVCQCGLLTTRSLTRVLCSTPLFGAMRRRLRTALAVPAEGALNGPAVALLKVRETPFLCLSVSVSSLILLEAGSRCP